MNGGLKKVSVVFSSRPDPRQVDLRFVRDAEHYGEVVEAVLCARTSVWIATANLKDVHVEAPRGTVARARSEYVSLYDELVAKARAGVEVRLLSSGAPSRALAGRIELAGALGIWRCCPRVHLKMVAVDGDLLYLGSANFTGAGLGAKSPNKRNFETGIVTHDPLLLDELQAYFDAIWLGRHCTSCRLRSRCVRPLDAKLQLKAKPKVPRSRPEPKGTKSRRPR